MITNALINTFRILSIEKRIGRFSNLNFAKGINVTVSDTTVWVDASAFDEGSWDNCGIGLQLARRSDWATACGVDICDDLELYCATEHHDSLFVAWLEEDKHINPVERNPRPINSV